MFIAPLSGRCGGGLYCEINDILLLNFNPLCILNNADF